MLKKLRKYLNIFQSFKSNQQELLQEAFDDNEKIARTIFSPINLNKRRDKILNNAYRSPKGIDEVSVNRLTYTTLDFCKGHAKNIEKPPERTYFGFAYLKVLDITSSDCNIVYTPKSDNIYHADIKVGCVLEKGESMPSEVLYKIKKLTDKSVLLTDPNPSSVKWLGTEVS